MNTVAINTSNPLLARHIAAVAVKKNSAYIGIAKSLLIEEAKRQMLNHPEWSNDVIAEQCGFGSRSYFQTVFKKQTGMTPSEFIKQNKI